MDYAIASDIGATNLRVSLVSSSGKLEQKSQYKTPQKNSKEVVNLLLDAINRLNIRGKSIIGIGVGVGAFVDFKQGKVVYAPNFEFSDIYLKDVLTKRFKLASFIDNDANLAILAEKTFGVGRNVKNMIGLTLGTGIGGAIIINGELYRGNSSAAGEIGHMTIKLDDKHPYSNNGEFETLASGRALDREARRAVKNNTNSLIYKLADGQIDKVSGILVTKAAMQGDKLARKLLEKHAFRLAVGLANIINIFDPQIITLNGGLAETGNLLISSAKDILKKRIFADTKRRIPDIVFGSLGIDAGLLGAGVVVFKELNA